MKILITGGAGFIGSNLADKLLSEEVAVFDNFTTGKRENLRKGIKIYSGSISDRDIVSEVFDKFKPDIIVHAAASYKNPNDWEEDVMTNILGGINIINAAKEVKKFIYFQTALCYGLNPVSPITLKNPLFNGGFSGGSSYAISKTAFEQYLELSGLDFVSFRLANIYGRRNLSGAVPAFFNKLVKGDKCTIVDARRDMVYIDDMLEVVIKAINGMGSKKYYHISSGRDYSIHWLYMYLRDLLGVKDNSVISQVSLNDTHTILLDNTDTKTDFEWDISTPIESGLRDAVEWYKEHTIYETYTHLKI